MNQLHDPTRQANYLRQCLAQDKRLLGLFLGAGCPLAIRVKRNGKEQPLIPDIPGLTQAVSDQMSASKQHKKVFESVLSHLKADGRQNPNVEDVLSHVRALRAVAGNDAVRGLTATDLDQIDQGICDTIVDVVSKSLPANDTPYNKVAAWVGAIQRTKSVEIFTTNYDLLLEEAMEESRVPYFDGFAGSRRAFFDPHAIEEDPLPARWARVWKLHGSINWRQDARGVVSRSESATAGDRRVIHPFRVTE
ncbi:MAG: SIR2 family protein [Verrucomicrobiia bacterium]